MDKMLLAKTHITVGKWMKTTGHTHHEEIIGHFDQSIKLCPSYAKKKMKRAMERDAVFGKIQLNPLFRLEKGLFFLGSYYDSFVANVAQLFGPTTATTRVKQSLIPRNQIKVLLLPPPRVRCLYSLFFSFFNLAVHLLRLLGYSLIRRFAKERPHFSLSISPATPLALV